MTRGPWGVVRSSPERSRAPLHMPAERQRVKIQGPGAGFPTFSWGVGVNELTRERKNKNKNFSFVKCKNKESILLNSKSLPTVVDTVLWSSVTFQVVTGIFPQSFCDSGSSQL